MTSLKLLAVCIIALAASGCANPFVGVFMHLDDRYNVGKFHANITVKLNYGDAVETVETYQPTLVSPPLWITFFGHPARNVDEIKSITFKYKSVDSPKDKLALDKIQLGQNYLRGKYYYTQDFNLQDFGWLEQNKKYTAVARNN